jgi:2-polyprenyl-6-methoxyphenol hydroxylase-like FAD-dependent oxidoreductase
VRVVVNGAGAAGLTSALLLARAGHEVVLLERDSTPLPATADAAFEWDRRGAPQVRHSHAFLARLRNLLRDHLPDVLHDLLAAGATEVSWADTTPETLDDTSPQPGDEDLTLLACRRTTFEWVLRRAALSTDRVALHDGVTVTGITAASDTAVPRISGVRSSSGLVPADLVLDASGRRSALPRLLAELAADLPGEEQDTGIIYLSRFYRLLPGATQPDRQALIGGDLGYLKYGVFRGDNRTFSVTLAVGTDDAELRSVLNAERFDTATRLVPAIAPWVDATRAVPITKVHVMGGLINRIRRMVVDGRPVALGLLAVGDAAVCTNPLYGRGCSLGAVHALLCAEALREHEGDLEALALAFDELTRRELEPWYHAAVAQDALSKQALGGEDLPPGPPIRSLISEGLFPLARVDAEVHRAWMRTLNLLTPPDALLVNEDLMNRVLSYWQRRDERPPEPPLGPPRAEMVAALHDH